ncbi:MAG TPA: ComF family protein [Gammaproteobacteria bacterium]
MKTPKLLYNWLNNVQRWLYPPRCTLCGALGEGHYDLCRPCLNELPRNLSPCRQCGLPLEGSGAQLCGRCLKRVPPFDHAVIPLLYQSPLDRLILALKFHQGLAHARLLGQLLADAVEASESRPQLIIPVPLHPKRLRERGYNQALEIARPAAKRLNIPISLDHVQRTRHTETQTRLKYRERHKNMRGVFEVARAVPRDVAIVDDVVTSGSTVTALAKVLKQAGAERVDIWAVARAPLRG